MPKMLDRRYTDGKVERALTWAMREVGAPWYHKLAWRLSRRYRLACVARTQEIANEMERKIFAGDFR